MLSIVGRNVGFSLTRWCLRTVLLRRIKNSNFLCIFKIFFWKLFTFLGFWKCLSEISVTKSIHEHYPIQWVPVQSSIYPGTNAVNSAQFSKQRIPLINLVPIWVSGILWTTAEVYSSKIGATNGISIGGFLLTVLAVLIAIRYERRGNNCGLPPCRML